MKKIKYYFRRLVNMDFKGFFDAITHAHEKSGKSKIVITVDMILCSLKYTAGYVDYNEFEFYNLPKEKRETFVTLGQSHKIASYYNDPAYTEIFLDKAQFNKHFTDYVGRQHLDLLETDAEGLKDFITKLGGKAMAKRNRDYVGHGIEVIDIREETDVDYEALYNKLKENGQILIEEYFSQHPKMSELAPNSVNTIRMITFLDDEGEGHLLVAALKSGLGGHLDNIGQGGMYTILNEDGVVHAPFIDAKDNDYTINPNTGESLIGFQVPSYDKVKEQVLAATKIIPQVRYVGWDVAVRPSGDAEIIEGNVTTGVFQEIPRNSTHQTGVLPEYKKYIKIKL